MMRRTKHVIGEIVFYSFVVVIALGAYSMLSSLVGDVPEIDGALRPVVQFGYTDRATRRHEDFVQKPLRTEDRACWTLYLEKLRAASIVKWDFYVEGGGNSAQIPTSAYTMVNDDAPDPNPMREHGVGAQWQRRWCFDIAGRVPPFKSMTIIGKAWHKQFPYLWVTETPVPRFTITPRGDLAS